MTKIIHGDCVEQLRNMNSNTIDALVTDPPAGISFMGKAWDGDRGGRKEWVAWLESVMRECLRVLKPGGHGLVWAIPRTSHWTATALEDAGFEIRDVVTHLFGSGFPKSMNLGKAIDREITSAASAAWDGWGTALKPASEHWILVRKPISEKTVAANVKRWGVGGINVDGCRVESPDADHKAVQRQSDVALFQAKGAGHVQPTYNPQGRFPANLVLSHAEECEEAQCSLLCPVRELDEQSGSIRMESGVVRTTKHPGFQPGQPSIPQKLKHTDPLPGAAPPASSTSPSHPSASATRGWRGRWLSRSISATKGQAGTPGSAEAAKHPLRARTSTPHRQAHQADALPDPHGHPSGRAGARPVHGLRHDGLRGGGRGDAVYWDRKR